jgi:hypothetical protein
MEEKDTKVSKALIVDIPFDKLRRANEGLSDKKRCQHEYNGMRCLRPRASKYYCNMHEDWDNTMLSTEGVPMPDSPESLQAFLMKMLNMVYRSSSKTPEQLAAIQTIVKLMAKNAHYLLWLVVVAGG